MNRRPYRGRRRPHPSRRSPEPRVGRPGRAGRWSRARDRRCRPRRLDRPVRPQLSSSRRASLPTSSATRGTVENRRVTRCCFELEAREDTRLLVLDVPTLGGGRCAVEPSFGDERSAPEAQLDEHARRAFRLHTALKRRRDEHRRGGRRPRRRQDGRRVHAREQDTQAGCRRDSPEEGAHAARSRRRAARHRHPLLCSLVAGKRPPLVTIATWPERNQPPGAFQGPNSPDLLDASSGAWSPSCHVSALAVPAAPRER